MEWVACLQLPDVATSAGFALYWHGAVIACFDDYRHAPTDEQFPFLASRRVDWQLAYFQWWLKIGFGEQELIHFYWV